MPSRGTCFLCGKTGSVEYHHVFGGALRDKSTEYGLIAPLCGESCHRNGKYSVHRCKDTADRLREHFQFVFMVENKASVQDFRNVFYKNCIDLSKIEDERSYPMNIDVKTGRLTADPVLRKTAQDVSVTSFSIAVRRPHNRDGVTDYFDCVAWRSNAEFICKYFHKGDWIEIHGYTKNDKYEKNGETKKRNIIEVEGAFFGGSRVNHEEAASNGGSEYPQSEYENDPGQSQGFSDLGDDDGDLPF